MTIIGITGPTGAGKTTALNELKTFGGCIIDADAVYHGLLANDGAMRKELEERFGPLTDEQGNFQRKKLGAVVFADPDALEDLNRIVNRYIVRAVREELAKAEQAGCPVAAIDAIRLFESGLSDLCQVTLAITAPAEIRVRRIMEREGITEEYARARVAAQNPDEFYTRRCGHTLINDFDSPVKFAAKAHALFESILRT